MKQLFAATALALSLAGAAHAAGHDAAPSVYFVTLEDGASVASPVKVVFGLSGKGVAPAGVERDMTGHHHILVNRAPWGEGPLDAEMAETGLAADENHLHFGGGQTETLLDLAPGTYTLQLVLGDAFHVPHDPPVVSEQISITVTE